MNSLNTLYGEEELFRFEALDQLRQQAASAGYYEREIIAIEAQADWDSIPEVLENTSLFASIRLIEIHIPDGKPGNKGAEIIQWIVNKLNSELEGQIMIIFFLPKLDKQQQNSQWFKALQSTGHIIHAKKLEIKHLTAWIKKRLEQKKLTIDQEALYFFAEKVEGNLLAAQQEIDKLALLYPADTFLRFAQIKSMIADVSRFDIFSLAEAWMQGDQKRVVRLCDGLEASGVEAIQLLGLISEDIRTLIRLSGALQQGQHIAALRNRLRLWGSKQQAAQQAINRIRTPRLIQALQECAVIDRAIKGVEKGDVWYGFRKLLSDLSR